MSTKKSKIGFIGLGLMGSPMAKNILKAGYPLSVYNRNPKRLKDFKDSKIFVAHSPAELARNVDVVISCVTGPKDVKDVMLGVEGVVYGGHEGLVAVDMSTIGPTAAREVAEGLKKAKIPFLDAPVTGGTIGAQKGTLTIFIGGDEEVYKKVKPVFEAMGKDLQYMGKQGMGQAMKLVNNLIIGISTEVLAEGLLLGEVLGLKRQRVAEVLQNGFAVSPAMKFKMPNMVSNKFPVSFSVSNIRKDLRLAMDEGKGESVKGKETNFPVLKIVESLYKKGMENGLSENDLSAIIKILSFK